MTLSPEPPDAVVSMSRPPVVQFQLGVDEPAAEGIHRIALEQVDLIIWHAERLGDGDEHVHGVRKTSKRVRALLRLIRGELGEEAYRRENAALRDVARELSALRTATVEIEILKGLADDAFEAEGFRWDTI